MKFLSVLIATMFLSVLCSAQSNHRSSSSKKYSVVRFGPLFGLGGSPTNTGSTEIKFNTELLLGCHLEIRPQQKYGIETFFTFNNVLKGPQKGLWYYQSFLFGNYYLNENWALKGGGLYVINRVNNKIDLSTSHFGISFGYQYKYWEMFLFFMREHPFVNLQENEHMLLIGLGTIFPLKLIPFDRNNQSKQKGKYKGRSADGPNFRMGPELGLGSHIIISTNDTNRYLFNYRAGWNLYFFFDKSIGFTTGFHYNQTLKEYKYLSVPLLPHIKISDKWKIIGGASALYALDNGESGSDKLAFSYSIGILKPGWGIRAEWIPKKIQMPDKRASTESIIGVNLFLNILYVSPHRSNSRR